jgi:hypothetical protein
MLARRIPLHQVRSFAELSDCIAIQPNAVAFIEVTSSNFEPTLSWLTAKSRDTSDCRFIAALDRSVTDRSAAAAALREAGAVDVARSPRRLQGAVGVGLLHLRRTQRADTDSWTGEHSIEEWARSLLPWQGLR